MSIFGNKYNKLTEINSKLFEFTVKGEYRKLESEIYRMSNLNDITDKYNNTLLHVAVLSKKYDIIQLLLDMGISIDLLNTFQQDALDVAAQLNDRKIINMLIFDKIKKTQKTQKIQALEKDNKKLKNDLADNKVQNNTLLSENKMLSNKNNKLLTEANNLNNNNKRMREEINELSEKNKELVTANKKLKKSVETMIDSLRNH